MRGQRLGCCLCPEIGPESGEPPTLTVTLEDPIDASLNRMPVESPSVGRKRHSTSSRTRESRLSRSDSTQTPMEFWRPSTGERDAHLASMRVLSQLDDRLIERLEAGDIRLCRVSWLMQPTVTRIMRRQELEELELSGVNPSPLLRPSEAAALVRRGSRSAGALTYGWLSPGDPDPDGHRLLVLRQTLAERPYIRGLFWECAARRLARLAAAATPPGLVTLFSWRPAACITPCHAPLIRSLPISPIAHRVTTCSFASLFQPPRNGERTAAEYTAFKRALGVMADVYASAVGTTVLRTSPPLNRLRSIASPPSPPLNRLVCIPIGSPAHRGSVAARPMHAWMELFGPSWLRVPLLRSPLAPTSPASPSRADESLSDDHRSRCIRLRPQR